LGLPTISLLLAKPNIVIRPAAARNIGCRGMQSDRVLPMLFGLFSAANLQRDRPYKLQRFPIRLGHSATGMRL